MILKGNQRGGGRQMALHLLNGHQNEHVEVMEVRGFVSEDVQAEHWQKPMPCPKAQSALNICTRFRSTRRKKRRSISSLLSRQ